MASLFDKIKSIASFGDKENKVAIDSLLPIFNGLSLADEKYPERVINYIIHGKDPILLQDFANRKDDMLGTLLDFPGTIGYYWGSYRHQYNMTANINRHITQSKNARHKLYKHIFKTLTPEQIIRYSKVLAAATKSENYTVISPAVPKWFTYLVVDALKSTMDRDRDVKYRSNWTFEKLLKVLMADDVLQKDDSESDGLTDESEQALVAKNNELLIKLMFERKEIDEYYTNSIDLIYQLPDTLEVLENNRAFVESFIPTLSAKGQKQFIDNLANSQPNVIQKFPSLVAILSTSKSKTVREIAASKVNTLPVSMIQPYLIDLLHKGNASQRRQAADIIARQASNTDTDSEMNKNIEGSETNNADTPYSILKTALKNEKQTSVIQAIESALSRLQSLDEMEESSYKLPEIEPLVTQPFTDNVIEILTENYQELLEKKRIMAEKEIEDNKSSEHPRKWMQDNYKYWKKMKPTQYGANLLAALNGKGNKGLFNNNALNEIIGYKKRLQSLPEYGLHHAIRLSVNNNRKNNGIMWHKFENVITPEMLINIELRQLAQVMKDCDIENPEREIGEQYLENTWSPVLPRFLNRPEQIVPFFTQHIDYLSEALGLLPNQSESSWYKFEPVKAMEILAKFETIPKQFIPRLLEYALGESKTVRQDAQDLLSNLPNIHERAIEALGNGKQAIRVTAVEWLVRLNEQDDSHKEQVIKALYQLLEKEKKEIVIASILTALEDLGEDISKYLSPSALLKDAEKGLKGKTLKSFQWFDLQSLPPVKWQNGETVNPLIIQWWVTLAEKLKDPNPNGLLQRYMGLLDENSQQALAEYLLQTFIAEDTRTVSVTEATETAQKEAPARLQSYKDSYNRWGKDSEDSWWARYENITLEQVIEEIKREQLSIYLGSAIKSKGLLALTYKARGSKAVSILQEFMKQHYRRNAQLMAMLTAFANSDDPLVIQLLLGLSRRYRTSSIQDLAKELVTQIAERNNWTADELADRTIPTAGLDDNGLLILDYDSRTLTAFVNEKDKFVLQNESGKVIKSMPAPRKNDDAAIIKEAKSLFSNSKKELKQVLSLQTARLYESMCSERMWHSSDWLQYLFTHPIMKRLISRLVWLEVDAEGKLIRVFRPDEDGALLDIDDEEISLSDDSFVKLAHAVLVDQEACDNWREHLKDYEVKPLFSQFDHHCPQFEKEANQIDEFKGYVTDTFTLRGVLTKMGYQRASIEDAGSFDRYFKNYDSLGISAVIVFSGSYVPEENIPTVLFELCFETKQSYSWNTDYILLKDVNPILLAESYAEYKKVAEATSGYDEEWEKKTLW